MNFNTGSTELNPDLMKPDYLILSKCDKHHHNDSEINTIGMTVIGHVQPREHKDALNCFL